MVSVNTVKVLSLIDIHKLLCYFDMHCLAVQSIVRRNLHGTGCLIIYNHFRHFASGLPVRQ